MWSERDNLWPERDDLRAYFQFERTNLRAERLNLKPESPDLKPPRPSLKPERLKLRGMNEQINEQTNKPKSPCVLQDCPLWGHCSKVAKVLDDQWCPCPGYVGCD